MGNQASHAAGAKAPKAHCDAARGFVLVLSGGGARGFVHAGALRALEHLGYRPAAVVGVSMGAIVAATYALNPDWYTALVDMDTSGFPTLPDITSGGIGQRIYNLYRAEKFVSSSWYGWGVGEAALEWGLGVLRELTLDKHLEDGRIPVCVTATDLVTGERIALCEGPAWEQVYSSSALAGLLPPAQIEGRLLVDGGYSDIAPVDLARSLVDGPVIAIDAFRVSRSDVPRNGLQAMLRGLEICQNEHAALRFAEADLVLQPRLTDPIATLDFPLKRHAISAGVAMVLNQRTPLADLLRVRTPTPNGLTKVHQTEGAHPAGQRLSAQNENKKETTHE